MRQQHRQHRQFELRPVQHRPGLRRLRGLRVAPRHQRSRSSPRSCRPSSSSYEEAWEPFEDCTGIDDRVRRQRPVRGPAPDAHRRWQRSRHRVHPAARPARQDRPDGRRRAGRSARPSPTTSTSTGTRRGRPTAPSTAPSTRAPLSSNMKSFVWYSPTVFKEKGYTVPTTWDELYRCSATRWSRTASSRGAVASSPVAPPVGRPPTGSSRSSCVSPAATSTTSGSRTRSSSTRPRSPRPWTPSPAWMKNPDYVNAGFGDVKTIATTAFQDAGKPILERQVRHAPAGVVLRAPSGRPSRRTSRSLRTATSSPSTCPQIDPAVAPTRSSVAASSSPRSRTVPRSRPSRPTCPRRSTRPLEVHSPAAGSRPTAACRSSTYTGPDRGPVGQVPDRPGRRRSASTPPTSCRLLSARVPSGSR